MRAVEGRERLRTNREPCCTIMYRSGENEGDQAQDSRYRHSTPDLFEGIMCVLVVRAQRCVVYG